MRRNGIAVLAGILLTSIASGAATYRRLTLDALIQNSTCIVYGRIVDSRPEWDPATRTIWTHTKVQVLDAPKGDPGTTVSLTEPGGIVNGVGELYPGIPQFRVGQEMVLFVYRAPGNRLRVTGAEQGVYTVTADPRTGERIVQPRVQPPEVFFEEGAAYARRSSKQSAAPEGLSKFLYNIRQKAASR